MKTRNTNAPLPASFLLSLRHCSVYIPSLCYDDPTIGIYPLNCPRYGELNHTLWTGSFTKDLTKNVLGNDLKI